MPDPRDRYSVPPHPVGLPWTHIVHDGLAVHTAGLGPPVLLMPNPQGMVRSSEWEGPLAAALLRSGNRVLTFDPPGAFASTRPPALGLREMVDAAVEALETAAVDPPVDVVGHSQATLCTLALALARPDVVRRLVLVGPVDGGWRSTRRARGMPWCWPVGDPRRWRFARLSLPLAFGLASPSRLARFQRFLLEQSMADPTKAPAVAPAAARTSRLRWQLSIRRVDLRPRLGAIRRPALICVGRADPQTPVGAAARIAAELPAGQLHVFAASGHYPQLEEPEEFDRVLARFLERGPG